MAVRLALAETSIINETKKYFSENGVCIESFMKRQTKSKNIILVKNITGKVEEDEIVVLFSQFGELGRVVLPPAKTICLVEFVHENDAKSAFKKLAYSKFKDLPLFLEWAAQDTFSESLDIEALEQKRKERDEEKKQKAEIVLSLQNDLTREAPIDHSEATAVLYVKNLNFTTTELLLKTTFQAAGNLRSVRIPMKVNPKTGAKQSMGFGFLDFGSKEDAMNCLKTMQNHSLEGHNLILKYSAPQNRIMQKDKESKVTESQETGTKLMIRNIPFEATKSDIKKLFT
jgi:multiple RNA-binding domain-containing protein 1